MSVSNLGDADGGAAVARDCPMTPRSFDESPTGDDRLRLLTVSPDPAFAEEIRSAVNLLADRRVILYAATSLREGLDVARDRQPHFVIVDLVHDVRDLTAFARDVHAGVHGVHLAGAFQPHRFGHGDADSTMLIDLFRAEMRDFLRRPVSPTELREVIERLSEQRGRIFAGAPARGRVISFVSNKGGVGKSTLSVNVACALAREHPEEVLLVDTSLQLGVCALLLDLRPATTLVDVVRERERLDETLLRGLTIAHESGVRLLAAPGDALEAADVTDEAVARVLHLARRTFRYVVVDTFPLLDSVVMAILDDSDLVFVVLQATAPSVAGIMRFVPVLESLGVPLSRQRIVLNRNHRRFFGDLSRADIEGRLGRSVDYAVPYAHRLVVSMNTGRPWVLGAPRWTRFARAVNAIVRTITGIESGSASVAGASARLGAPLESEILR
jgi:pilus assembly protein CpaE